MYTVSTGTIIAEVSGQFLEILGKPQGSRPKRILSGRNWRSMLRAAPTERPLLNPVTGGSGASNHYFPRNVLAFVIFLFYWWLHRHWDGFTMHGWPPLYSGFPISNNVSWWHLVLVADLWSTMQPGHQLFTVYLSFYMALHSVCLLSTNHIYRKKGRRRERKRHQSLYNCRSNWRTIIFMTLHLHRTWSYFQVRSFPAVARSPPMLL